MAGDTTPTTNSNNQTFDFETMAVVLYAMAESGVTLGTKHYEMMSAMDGKRGAHGFQHQFRKVKARAKELGEMAAKAGSEGGGGGLTPVVKSRGKGAGGSAKKSGGGKRSKSFVSSLLPISTPCVCISEVVKQSTDTS
jgi:hypothetical protein